MILSIKGSRTFLFFPHLLHRYTGTKCPLHLPTCLTSSGKLFAQISFLSSSGQACTGLTSQPHSCSDWGLLGKVDQARELISKYPVVAVHEARDLPGHSCSRSHRRPRHIQMARRARLHSAAVIATSAYMCSRIPSIHRHSHFNFCPRDRVSATHPSRLELQIFAYRYKFNRTDSQVGKNRWQFTIFIHSFNQSQMRPFSS